MCLKKSDSLLLTLNWLIQFLEPENEALLKINNNIGQLQFRQSLVERNQQLQKFRFIFMNINSKQIQASSVTIEKVNVQKTEENIQAQSLYQINNQQRNNKQIYKKKIFACLAFILGSIIITFILNSDLKNHAQMKSEINQLKKQLQNNKTDVQKMVTKIYQLQKIEQTLKEQLEKQAIVQKQLEKQIIRITSMSKNQTKTNDQVKPNNTKSQQILSIKQNKYQINTLSPQKQGTTIRKNGTVSQIIFLTKNQNNQTVDQFIYQNRDKRAERINFHENRIAFLKTFPRLQSINLAAYNNKINTADDQQQNLKLKLQYERINKKHELQKYTNQLPMCIISPSFRNNAKFRIQYNLNSIFTQNYTNYFAVIINDASDDGSDQIFTKYFQFYKIPKERYVYIKNTKKKGAMENTYIANHKFCSKDAITVHLDGDDQFIGKNVLIIFNAAYQKKKAGALYSNFYFYMQGGYISTGFTSEFPQHVKNTNSYKTATMHYSHLKTYRTQIFQRLDKSNFLNQRGNFFETASDVAFYIAVMEASCGRVYKVDGFHYLYNTGTGNNDDAIDRGQQVNGQYEVRAKPVNKCDQQFNKKMNSLP